MRAQGWLKEVLEDAHKNFESMPRWMKRGSIRKDNLFVGCPVYLCGQGYSPESHGLFAIIAFDITEAKEKVIDYFMQINPHTHREIWTVENLRQVKEIEGAQQIMFAAKVLLNADIPVLYITHEEKVCRAKRSS